MLTFSAFFAASAPDRLSKVTNPTGWKAKRKKHSVTTDKHFYPAISLIIYQGRIEFFLSQRKRANGAGPLVYHLSVALKQFLPLAEGISPVLMLT